MSDEELIREAIEKKLKELERKIDRLPFRERKLLSRLSERSAVYVPEVEPEQEAMPQRQDYLPGAVPQRDHLMEQMVVYNNSLVSMYSDSWIDSSLLGLLVATWDEETERVRLLSNIDCLPQFGYVDEYGIYLESFEVLFLMEVGLLVFQYNEETLDLIEAMLFLLGDKDTSKVNKYLVFSYLTKCGYILRNHQKALKEAADHLQEDNGALLLDDEDDEDRDIREKVRAKLEEILLKVCKQVKSKKQITEESAAHFCNTNTEELLNLANKLAQESSGQKHSKSVKSPDKDIGTFVKLEKAFSSFNIVEMDVQSERRRIEMEHDAKTNVDVDTKPHLDLSFNMYLPDKNFDRDCPGEPVCFVSILEIDHLPSSQEMFQFYDEELHLPILVIPMSDIN